METGFILFQQLRCMHSILFCCFTHSFKFMASAGTLLFSMPTFLVLEMFSPYILSKSHHYMKSSKLAMDFLQEKLNTNTLNSLRISIQVFPLHFSFPLSTFLYCSGFGLFPTGRKFSSATCSLPGYIGSFLSLEKIS